MKADIQTSRIDKALQVIEHMKEGKDITQAFRLVGIRQSTFEKVCEENPAIFDELREVVVAHAQRVKELFAAYSYQRMQELEAEEITDKADILARLRK
jgi:hypothetical protein